MPEIPTENVFRNRVTNVRTRWFYDEDGIKCLSQVLFCVEMLPTYHILKFWQSQKAKVSPRGLLLPLSDLSKFGRDISPCATAAVHL